MYQRSQPHAATNSAPPGTGRSAGCAALLRTTCQWAARYAPPDSATPVVFFFSSRRRHTIYGRVWSSDVCSSDLGEAAGDAGEGGGPAGVICPGFSCGEDFAEHGVWREGCDCGDELLLGATGAERV